MTETDSKLTLKQITLLVLAIVGCLVSYPIVLKQRGVVESCADLPLENMTDETYYLSYLMAAARGEGTACSLVFAEHAETVQPKVAWAEYVWGSLLRPFGLQAATVYWLNYVLTLMILVYLFSLLLKRLQLDPWPAACFGFLVVTAVFNLYLFRAVHPRVSGVLFWLSMLALFCWWQKPSHKSAVILALSLGLQYFNYPYYWAFNGLVCLLLGGFLLWQKDRQRLTQLVLATVTGLVLGIVPLQGLREVAGSDALPGLLERLSYVDSEAVFSKSAFLWLVVAFMSARRLASGPLFAVLSLAAVLAINQQVVTGNHPSESRYVWFIIKPLLAVQLIQLLMSWDKLVLFKKWLPVSALVVACGFWGLGFERHLHAVEGMNETVIQGRQGRTTAEWLAARTESDAVVLVPLKLAPWITLYARRPLYVSLHGNTQLLSQQEWSRRLHAWDWLQGMTPETYDNLLERETSPRTSTHFLSRFHRSGGGYENVPDDIKASLKQQYANYCEDNKLTWTPLYQVDYLFLPKGHGRESHLAAQWTRGDIYGEFELWSRLKP